MMKANLDSVFYTVRAAARRMADGGKIIIVSSTAGQRGEAGHSHYAASKGAVISFVKSLAVELAARDIQVNAVAPGWVDTDMAAAALESGAVLDEVIASIPLGRIGSADDIAGPILFLCSKLSRHVTGEVLNVNGGSVLCG
jgi:3-oxoacyl-[acyl-carrier protein] reductase